MTIFSDSNVRGHEVSGAGPETADDARNRPSAQAASAEGGSLIVSVIAFVFALVLYAVWADSRSTFEQCIAISDSTARMACYEEVRHQETRPPAKGGNAPALSHADK